MVKKERRGRLKGRKFTQIQINILVRARSTNLSPQNYFRSFFTAASLKIVVSSVLLLSQEHSQIPYWNIHLHISRRNRKCIVINIYIYVHPNLFL